MPIAVEKAGRKPQNGADYVDAVSGGTITSKGVQSMLPKLRGTLCPIFRIAQFKEYISHVVKKE